MHDVLNALYLPDGDGFVGTILTQGPWHVEHQHGGPVAALIARCVQAVPTLADMEIKRFTFDLIRPVPVMQRLDIDTRVLRQGKKVQLIEANLRVGDLDYVRCTALRLRVEDLRSTHQVPQSDAVDARIPAVGSFEPVNRDFSDAPFLRAVDIIRFQIRDSDKARLGYWTNLTVPLVAGETTTPLSRLCLAADLTNCIGIPVDEMEIAAINADITVQVVRPPVGELVALVGDTQVAMSAGIATSVAALHDRQGVCGTALTSQLIQT